MDFVFKGRRTNKKTEIVLPLNPEKAKPILEKLDGTTERILMQTPTGIYEVWQKMAEQQQTLIINNELTTRIGEYDIPGKYKFLGYNTLSIENFPRDLI